MTKNIIKFQKILAECIYLFIIAFFCYTASNKLVNLDSFRTNLIKTTIFNIEQAEIFSVFVIVFEIAIILLLIFRKQLGLLAFSFTILLFTLYISYLRFKGLYEVCGCGGILNGLKYEYHLLINIGLIIGSLYCLLIFNFFNNEK